MANQDPRSLGNAAVIDLKTSPRMSKGLDYFLPNSQQIDIMFSPRGTVVGRLSGAGIIQFVLSDREDALLSKVLCASLWNDSTPYNIGDCVAPTVNPTASPLVGARNGFIYQLTGPSGGGTSGSTQPSWPVVAGTTVSDGSLTWTCLAAPDGCSNAKRERLIVSLKPATGMTAVHPVYVSQQTEDADPYRYAETGEVARQ